MIKIKLDFVSIEASPSKRSVSIYPEFIVKKSKDLMIRGKSFYAIWDEETGFWSKDEDDVQRMIDTMIREYADNYNTDLSKDLKLLGKFSSNKWSEWQKYCKSLPDNYHELDDKIIFSNTPISKKDYMTKTLPYPIQDDPIPAYDEMMSILYEPEQRQKLEWAIGSIISGDSKKIQKFIVLYGGPGTGKSTVLNIIQSLFPGYYSVFESKALSSNNNAFALEAFRDNPLIAIQHDGDLSKIEDNTKLNSIVSHEMMVVNEKFKATYSSRFNSFLFMGTNKPVKITDAKSGILRRLIDVVPSGNRIPRKRYEELKHQIEFELGGIAYRCLHVYNQLGYSYYDDYIPLSMVGATNDFYNFLEDNFDFFKDEAGEGIMLSVAWKRYKEYCEDANIGFPYSLRVFKSELKNYYREFYDRYNGHRSVFVGLKEEKFDYIPLNPVSDFVVPEWLNLKHQESEFDYIAKEYPAQYATENETPKDPWDQISTTLADIDTRLLHYVRVPENHIVIDFDLKNSNGDKDYEKNLKAAAQWPQTYAETSKGGAGLHLHYIYTGDVNSLSKLYSDGIEIKVFSGKSSLRRKLTRCNDIPIATISSGLPLKEVNKKVLDVDIVKSEKGLRRMIERNLKKEFHPGTKPSIDFIKTILDDAYNSGMKYDVTDMRPLVQCFALGSTHQPQYCMRMVSKMKFKSDDPSENKELYSSEPPIVFFDVEVFPNLFIVCWKRQGPDFNVVRMINPTPEDIEELTKLKLVGFNNRKYDNHILYARMMGYTEEQLYRLSQRIINDHDKESMFGEAYNLSYTDIYDFLSAGNKMSLKKWEIKLGIFHLELGLPWDQPVPKELWNKVAEYCENDVIATEAVFNANQEDWEARQILAEWAHMTVNDTTNSLTTRLIVGNDKNPWDKFIYTDLSTIYPGYRYNEFGIPEEDYIPGTKIVSGKSIYKGLDPGEGGYVYAKPGIYYEAAVLDIESMHPHSIITLEIWGHEYTMRFSNIVCARLCIKHKDFEGAKQYLPEELHHYLNDKKKAKKLGKALKTPINSAYGLTSAKFQNALRDPRNKDNIVAKYGALFMINLKGEVEKRGFTVAHIKTDSIKIPNATPSIIQFCCDFAKKYGFTFQHESTYKKMCLVNDAVYIAQYATAEWCEQMYGYIPENNAESPNKWTATGTQFQIPYVFKTLFSGEEIKFEDMVETKSVTSALYLDFNENLGENEHNYRFVGKVGAFCPILPGNNAGVLVREKDEKMYAATGTKKKGSKDETYRWMEAPMVRNLGIEDQIDRSYYDELVKGAIQTIEEYGSFEDFVNDEPDEPPFQEDFPMNKPEAA